jgi:hypothetical protein
MFSYMDLTDGTDVFLIYGTFRKVRVIRSPKVHAGKVFQLPLGTFCANRLGLSQSHDIV